MNQIAALNSSLRKTFLGGRIEISHEVAGLSESMRLKIVKRLQALTPNMGCTISPDGDFGTFSVDRKGYQFRIFYHEYPGAANFCDVFQPVVLSPATDPATPYRTLRVLVISAEKG